MALPLPKVVADVQAGGPLATSMEGINALRQSNTKAEYAPYTAYSDAASKLAYARLMGPQFLAKLMGNPDVVANNPQLQDPRTGAALYQAGMGANALGGPSAATNAMNSMPVPGQSNSSNPLARVGHALANVLGFGDSSAPTQAPNAMLQPSQNSNQQSAPQPVSAPIQPGTQGPGTPGTGDNSGMSYDANGNNIVGSSDNIGNRGAPSPSPSTPNPNQYAENVANYKGIIKAGEAQGTARGNTIADLGKQQVDLSNQGVIIDRLIDTVKNPQFQEMRNQIPFFQDKQLNVLSKMGTPEQQQMIGDFMTTAQNMVASTVNSFHGKAMDKEFTLANKMKINDNDTVNVAMGKLTALRTLKDIAQAKNDQVIDLMQNKNMNEGDAIKQANKLINTKHIEDQVNNLMNPPVTIMYKNNQKYHIPNEKVEAAKKAGYSNG